MGWEVYVLPTNIRHQESSEVDENLCADISMLSMHRTTSPYIYIHITLYVHIYMYHYIYIIYIYIYDYI